MQALSRLRLLRQVAQMLVVSQPSLLAFADDPLIFRETPVLIRCFPRVILIIFGLLLFRAAKLSC